VYLTGISRSVVAVFADPKTLFGIKLGLAGLLSVYLSQLIRLGHANWALITVLVLAPAQYVGAIAQRSVARVAGTLIGGFVGIWLVGNYEQDVFFFLLFTFGYLFQASLELFRQQKGDPQYVVDVGAELSTAYEATELEFQILSGAVGSGSQIKNARLKRALETLELRIQDMLTSGTARNYSLEDVLDLANHQAALLTIHDEVLRLERR
jgi:hypothetical protein